MAQYIGSDGYGEKASNAPQRETPFSRLTGAVDRLRKVSEISSMLSVKLVGEEPPEATNREALPIVGAGMLGSVEDAANDIIRLAERITDNLARVERRI